MDSLIETKPRSKVTRKGMGGGLYKQTVGNSTSWLLRYHVDGKERHLGLGSTKLFSLKEARKRATLAKAKIVDGRMYADRPSKLTGEPCLHMELRLRGKQTLDRYGIDADSLSDNALLRSVLDANLHFYDWDECFDDAAKRAMGRWRPVMRKTDNGWLLPRFDRYDPRHTIHPHLSAKNDLSKNA